MGIGCLVSGGKRQEKPIFARILMLQSKWPFTDGILGNVCGINEICDYIAFLNIRPPRILLKFSILFIVNEHCCNYAFLRHSLRYNRLYFHFTSVYFPVSRSWFESHNIPDFQKSM